MRVRPFQNCDICVSSYNNNRIAAQSRLSMLKDTNTLTRECYEILDEAMNKYYNTPNGSEEAQGEAIQVYKALGAVEASEAYNAMLWKWHRETEVRLALYTCPHLGHSSVSQ